MNSASKFRDIVPNLQVGEDEGEALKEEGDFVAESWVDFYYCEALLQGPGIVICKVDCREGLF